MSFFKNYRTPFGYVADGNQVDAYGVDHSNFSTRDEVEYQFARQEREKQMAENLKQQGIEPENYPQLGTAFWGNNPENNYGFGASNISANIENRQNQTPLPNIGNINQSIWNRNQYQTPTPWAKNNVSEISNENTPQIQTKLSEIPRYWDTSSEGKKVWNYVQQQEGDIKPKNQNHLNYVYSLGKGIGNIYANYQTIAPIKMSDKYKHAVINCEAAQQGKGGYDIAKLVSWGKELKDVLTGQNTKDSSQSDNYANKIGRLLGTKYPNDNCRIIVQKYIDK